MCVIGRLKTEFCFQTALFISNDWFLYAFEEWRAIHSRFAAILHFPFQAEHGIARFAVEVAAVGGTAVLVFVVAFVGQVVDCQPQLQVFARAVLDVGIPNRVAALLDGAVGIGGFAAALQAQTDRPFAVIHRQDIAGVEAEHMFRRMAAEVVAFSARFNIVTDAVAVGAAVEGVACVNLPTVGQAAGDFGIQAAAALVERFPVGVRFGIDALVVVVFVGADGVHLNS